MVGYHANWWTSSIANIIEYLPGETVEYYFARHLDYSNRGIARDGAEGNNAYSVRCIKY